MKKNKRNQGGVVDAEVVESKELQLSTNFQHQPPPPELPEIEAKVEEPEPDQIYFEECREYLRCDFTDAEIIDLSKKLARQISEHSAAERELKEVTSQLKANVTAKETAMAQTASLVQNGYEYRTVDCQRFFDHPEKGKKSLIRMDTGDTVSIDRMSGDDLQGQLFRKQERERQNAVQ